jgi:hypothetical protein
MKCNEVKIMTVSEVYIDEGGLMLVAKEEQAILEVGGLPEED